MSAFTIVNSTDGTFRVHRKGCADIERRDRMNGQWDAEAASADKLVAREVVVLNEEIGGFDEGYFVVLPCARKAVE